MAKSEKVIDPTPDPAQEVAPEAKPVEDKPLFLDLAPLHALADNKTIRVPRDPSFSRKDVINAFQSAFDLIGGVPRLALWANANQTEFYKMYSKLIPSGASSAFGESNLIRLEMAIAPSPLDEVAIDADYRLIPPDEKP